MAYIDLNTDELENAAKIASRANESLTEAMNLLSCVVEHNDWTCAERDAINRNTVDNRVTSQALQNDAQSFYNAIFLAAENFKETEQQIQQSFSSVDSIISDFLSHVPSSSGTLHGGIGSSFDHSGSADAFNTGLDATAFYEHIPSNIGISPTAGISICDYQNLMNVFKGSK